jgi:O-methyltransferase involved in polyketide biosynthesis
MALLHPLSLTAHFNAQVWVRQGVPFAECFDTRKGRALFRLLEPLFRVAARAGYPTPLTFLAQRHHIMDGVIQRLEPVQLVELAAGLCPRGLAWAQREGSIVIESDLAPVVRLKRAMVGASVPRGYHLAALDLVASRDYAGDLEPALKRSCSTVVITEGILPYFSLALVRHVFRSVAALLRACGGGVYLTDVHHQQELDRLGPLARVFWEGLQLSTRTPRHRMIEDREQGTRLLRSAGFEAVDVHDPSAGSTASCAGMCVYEARIDP